MKEFITVKDRMGNGTTVPTVGLIYREYNRGTLDKAQTMNYLHDLGLVSDAEIKNFNCKVASWIK